MKSAHVISLLAFNANLQLAHWQADTVTNAHETLGELYDAVQSLTDELAEVNAGKENSTVFQREAIQLMPNVGHATLLATGLTICADIEAELDPVKDSDLANIVADIKRAINRARYKLKV